MLKALRDHYLRIDARSLGLFRILFGLVLIADLFGRWRWVTAFYSNEGALPNHNHLFVLKDTGYVWSFLHAFSSPLENHFAFFLILLVYLAFLIGWYTRAFHALALVCLVSLSGRDILLENAGNYIAIALLAFTLILPCGSRFSLDSLLISLRLEEEKTDRDLNRRKTPSESVINGLRLPGFSPVGLAALAVLLQVAVVFFCLAYQHDGQPWKDGSALYYGLHVERWTSGIGVAFRKLPPGVLSGYTYALHAAEWAIPPLLFVPVMRRHTRVVAAALIAFYGLSLGILFSYGLFGWSLAAASALVISSESWDAYVKSWNPRRARTVIYDADCGVCMLITRILKRFDLRGHLTFQGNDSIDELLQPTPPGKTKRIKRPEGLFPTMVLSSVVVVDPDGKFYTRSRAVAEAIQALPLGWIKAWPLRIPGVSHAADAFYDWFANRRQGVSELLGLGACGITRPDAGSDDSALEEAPPARRALNFITGSIRDLLAIGLLATMFAQTATANRVPAFFARIPQPGALAAAAKWSRMLARWDILAPAPPLEDSALILDGQTKGGQMVDPITGREPAFEPEKRRGAPLGQLWSDYAEKLHQKEWFAFQKAFRDYISKGGPAWKTEPAENQIVGFDAYWVTTPTPPPGSAEPPGAATREKMFTHSRGGKAGTDRFPPLLRPEPRSEPRKQ